MTTGSTSPRCGVDVEGNEAGSALLCAGEQLLCAAAVVAPSVAVASGSCLALQASGPLGETRAVEGLTLVTAEGVVVVERLLRLGPELHNNLSVGVTRDVAILTLASPVKAVMPLAAIENKQAFLAANKQNRETFLTNDDPKGIEASVLEEDGDGGKRQWRRRSVPLRGGFGLDDEEWHAGLSSLRFRVVSPLGGFLYDDGKLIGVYSRPYTVDAGLESDGGIFTDLTTPAMHEIFNSHAKL